MTTQNWSEDPLTVTPSGERVQSASSISTVSTEDRSGAAGVKDKAKDQAKEVGQEGLGAAQGVAKTAGTEAKNVAKEASTQAKNLLGELGSDIKDQAGNSQQKAAEGLRSISDELASMADNGDQSGPANSLVRQAAQRSGDVAGWLEGRDPGSLIEEVKGFARRRPGAFLMVAAGAGLLAGRLTRGLTGAGSDAQSASPANPAPEYPPTVPAQPSAGIVAGTDYSTPGYVSDPLASEPIIEPGRRTQDSPFNGDLR
ncbi:hypothetical protein [Arthrobacter sp. TMN-50]